MQSLYTEAAKGSGSAHKKVALLISHALDESTTSKAFNEAGLRKGDIIVRIDGELLVDAAFDTGKLAKLVSALPLDRPSRFKIRRDGAMLDVWVRPRPADETRPAVLSRCGAGPDRTDLAQGKCQYGSDRTC